MDATDESSPPPIQRPRASRASAVWPTTRSGWAAICFAALGMTAYVVAMLLMISRSVPGGEEALGGVARTIGPSIAAAFVASGLGALLASVAAIRIWGERATVVWLSLGYGVLAAVLLAGELLGRH